MHTNNGLPVRINSPGCSDRKSPNVRSAKMSDVIFVYASFSRLAAVGGDVFSLDVPEAVADEPPFDVALPVFVPLLFRLLLFAVVLPVRCILVVVIFFRIFAEIFVTFDREN